MLELGLSPPLYLSVDELLVEMNLTEVLIKRRHLFCEMRANRAQLRVFTMQKRPVKTVAELVDPICKRLKVI